MNVLLLSGGVGKRLWPLSKPNEPKQFLKLFKNEKNEYESMIQRIYKGVKKVDKNALVTIATSKKQVTNIKKQIKDKVCISIEPYSKDTFPAIVLAAAYLHYVKKISINDTIVVCPVDHYVDNDYFKELKKISRISEEGHYKLVLMGIEPTEPCEKFGYIIPESNGKIAKVIKFKEKPSQEEALKYIQEGALWNCGVFAFKIKYILDIAHRIIKFNDYYELYKKYDEIPKMSFDYVVCEKEENCIVVRFNGKWSDIGTWQNLIDKIDVCEHEQNSEMFKCENTNIVNYLDIPILGIGLKDIIIVASKDGIMVSDKNNYYDIKTAIDKICLKSKKIKK